MNIRIDLNHAPLDGETISFKAPCNASEVSGLIIYYKNESNLSVSKEFTLSDAHGGNIGVLDNIFAKGAIVKVIIDTDANNAFVQNPDTNTYLEGKLAEKYSPNNKPSPADIGAAKLQSPNDMLHNGNEFTFIPAGHSGELYINHRTASGATDGNISNYHFCDGKGGEATLIANYFKGKFQGKDARPIYNNEEVAMLSDVPSKTETWTFTLEDGSTVTKAVYVG